MSQHFWLEVLLESDDKLALPPELRSEIQGDATVVYSRSTAFVGLRDADTAIILSRQPGVRLLTSKEIASLKDTMADPLPIFPIEQTSSVPSSVGLGDVLAYYFGKLGLRECPGCSRRKGWLNRIVLWKAEIG